MFSSIAKQQTTCNTELIAENICSSTMHLMCKYY